MADEGVEFFRVLFLRHHPAAVEDFQSGSRIETQEFRGLLQRVGLVLLAPDERDALLQAGEALARVRVEIT